MEQHDERYYNIQKLNRIFAISSVLLLASLVLLFKDDFSRDWKNYQREFQKLEIKETKDKYTDAVSALNKEQEYQNLKEQIMAAQKEFDAKCSNLTKTDKRVEKLRAQNEIISQKFRVTKAQMDAAKFSYEEALGKGHRNLARTKKHYEQLSIEVNQLKLKLEDSEKTIKAQSQAREKCEQNLKELEKKKKGLTKQSAVLERKLKKIDPAAMSFPNRIGNFVRDLPIIDFANPNYKIEQIVIKDITDDVNFLRIPKVDRCITCHQGITNPDYKNAPQPFRTHPDLELYLGKNSAHPIEAFGCTSCHGGRGRGTDFTSSAHTPASEEQKGEWEKKYHWHKMHHWQTPMYSTKHVQAGCFKCHSNQTTIKGAEKLNLGLNLIEKSGCYACHTIQKYKSWPTSGPSLTHLQSKVSKDWAYRWIKDPKSFRHNTWMPSFFNQSNTNDPESRQRTQQEIHAMVHYLFKESSKFSLTTMPHWGDPQNGEKLITSVGCLGCHNINSNPPTSERTRNDLKREQGPNLIGLASKTSKTWIYNWLKDPKRYHAGTRMPSLQLTDREASDIAAYLAKDKNTAFSKQPIPDINEGIVNTIVESFMRKTSTKSQMNAKIKTMSLDDKLYYSGKKLISHYGCYSCHDIKGFQGQKPIGTELTEEGSKAVERLDFGFIHIDHSKKAFFKQKLKNPRIFDKGKVRRPDEKLKMPNYNFSDQEADAIVTALLGFVKDKPAASKMKERSTRNIAIEEGQKVVRQFNCQGCHIIEGEGGAIQPKVIEWLVKYDNRSQSEAEAIVASFSPPNLIGEGQKVHAEWLFSFLHEPITIRPWLKPRMPTYAFTTQELNTLVKYFNALDDQEFPFTSIHEGTMPPEEYEAGKKLFSPDYFDCGKCHIVGDKLPAGSPDSWAPDFGLAKSRLKPDWIIRWIKDPQPLLPGTKMPTFFDPEYFNDSGPDDILDGDEHEQIRVLRDYLLTLSENHVQKGTSDIPSASSPPNE